MDDLSIHFVTYNLRRAAPEGDISPLLALNNQNGAFDFYVIALQEVNSEDLLMGAFHVDLWTQKIIHLLNSRYIKLKTIAIQKLGIVLSVFAKKEHLLNIRDMEAWETLRTVSIRLEIYGTTICFVNSHLSPHDHQLSNRIKEYNDVIKEQQFHVKGQEKILLHDYIFWMGDLNFRLDEGFNKNPEEIESMIKKGELVELFKHDQLQKVRRTKIAFCEFSEKMPKFAPTFKFKVGHNYHDHLRRPAWCDRILYKFNPSRNENLLKLQVEQKTYQSHPNFCLSDHKPVTADFIIKVFRDCGEEVIKFSKVPLCWDQEENLVTYKFSRKFEINRNDWVGIYKVNFSSVDAYKFHDFVSNMKQSHDDSCSSVLGALGSPLEFNITFTPPKSKDYEGKYCLIYISETEHKVRSVFGMSEPFEIRSF